MRVVIDTDVGVDDAVALLMALHGFQKDEIVGITTVFGNVKLHQANHNVAHILKATGRTDIPVFSGAPRPMIASVSEERWGGHGSDGLGNQAGRADVTAAKKNDAVHALIDMAHAHSGELVIVALGPLTNVALAMLLDPSFMSHVKQLVVMGGVSNGEGNITPHAEFNVACDPEAWEIVVQHCVDQANKFFLVPIETCRAFALNWNDFDAIFDHATCTFGGSIREIWQFTKAYIPDGKFMPCDAYAVAMLLHPEYIVEATQMRGQVHLPSDERRGTNVWKIPQANEPANATIVTKIDIEIFKQLLHRLVAQ